MLKVVAVATLGWTLAICVGNAFAVEMSMPTGDFAHGSGGGAGEVETTAATARDVGAGAMHSTAVRDGEADVFVSAHERTPDSAADVRTDTTHAALGADTASPSASAPAHKARRNGHWQSLLPGVMK